MSILYQCEGSKLGKIAGELAINLARRLQIDEITAQFVIDPQAILQLEGFDGTAGFCGSGVFIEAEQRIIAPLVSLGESLLMAFSAVAEGNGLKVANFIDIGPRGLEIARRAVHSDLVVMIDNRQNPGFIEELATCFLCPVLLVRPGCVWLIASRASNQQTSDLAEHLTELNVEFKISRYSNALFPIRMTA